MTAFTFTMLRTPTCRRCRTPGACGEGGNGRLGTGKGAQCTLERPAELRCVILQKLVPPQLLAHSSAASASNFFTGTGAGTGTASPPPQLAPWHTDFAAAASCGRSPAAHRHPRHGGPEVCGGGGGNSVCHRGWVRPTPPYVQLLPVLGYTSFAVAKQGWRWGWKMPWMGLQDTAASATGCASPRAGDGSAAAVGGVGAGGASPALSAGRRRLRY